MQTTNLQENNYQIHFFYLSFTTIAFYFYFDITWNGTKELTTTEEATYLFKTRLLIIFQDKIYISLFLGNLILKVSILSNCYRRLMISEWVFFFLKEIKWSVIHWIWHRKSLPKLTIGHLLRDQTKNSIGLKSYSNVHAVVRRKLHKFS